MAVPVVEVRIVRMLVAHRFVTVPMRMRFGHRSVMGMLVVVIMHMGVFVFERIVAVFVLMSLSKV